jgi:hypothetical protein
MNTVEKIFSDFVFCSSCNKRMQPLVIVEELFTSEEQIVEVQMEYDEDNNEIGEREVVTGIKETFHESKLLKCSTKDCNRAFLHYEVSFEGGVIFRETIPFFQSWHLKSKFELDKYKIPQMPYRLYSESIKAFNSQMWYSCGVLIGSILEAICIEEKVKEKKHNSETKKREQELSNIENKIDELQKANSDENELKKLSDRSKELKNSKIIIPLESMLNILIHEKRLGNDFTSLVHALRNFRNETTHGDVLEIIIPKKEQLKTSIEMVEHLIEELYLKSPRLKELTGKLKEYKSRRGIQNLEIQNESN